jgi:hypothetical protein
MLRLKKEQSEYFDKGLVHYVMWLCGVVVIMLCFSNIKHIGCRFEPQW